MNNETFPITPPPELIAKWIKAHDRLQDYCSTAEYTATQAARWGYEQRGAVNEAELQKARDEELEACCEQLRSLGPGPRTIDNLRAARRPKPPSLKEQALDALGPEPLPERGPTGDTILNVGTIQRHRLICRALEQLDD